MMINGSLSCCYFIITSAAAIVTTPITLPTSYWRSLHILSGHKYPAEHEPQLLISTHTPRPREAFSFVQSSSNMSYLLGLCGFQPSPGRIIGGHAQKFGFSLSHAYLAHECYLWKWNLVSYGSAEQIQNQKNSPAQQASPSLWEWIMTLNDTAQIQFPYWTKTAFPYKSLKILYQLPIFSLSPV